MAKKKPDMPDLFADTAISVPAKPAMPVARDHTRLTWLICSTMNFDTLPNAHSKAGKAERKQALVKLLDVLIDLLPPDEKALNPRRYLDGYREAQRKGDTEASRRELHMIEDLLPHLRDNIMPRYEGKLGDDRTEKDRAAFVRSHYRPFVQRLETFLAAANADMKDPALARELVTMPDLQRFVKNARQILAVNTMAEHLQNILTHFPSLLEWEANASALRGKAHILEQQYEPYKRPERDFIAQGRAIPAPKVTENSSYAETKQAMEQLLATMREQIYDFGAFAPETISRAVERDRRRINAKHDPQDPYAVPSALLGEVYKTRWAMAADGNWRFGGDKKYSSVNALLKRYENTLTDPSIPLDGAKEAPAKPRGRVR